MRSIGIIQSQGYIPVLTMRMQGADSILLFPAVVCFTFQVGDIDDLAPEAIVFCCTHQAFKYQRVPFRIEAKLTHAR